VEPLWIAFVVALALSGVVLTLAWRRAQARRDVRLKHLEDEALRRARRAPKGPPTSPGRPRAPTPDLVSVREAWAEQERTEERERVTIHAQDRGTPTAPSGPRIGPQGPVQAPPAPGPSPQEKVAGVAGRRDRPPQS
jgi:hypothetical protein